MTTGRKIKSLPHKRHYYRALARGIVVSASIIFISLFLGAWGYHYFFGLGFYDSLLNASMILTGMGPVAEAQTNAAKLFASIYALYSGIAFLTSCAIVFTPAIRRFLHRFHLDINE